MLALKILDVKNCMNHMLLQETFDGFLLAEASIVTRVSYVIDGHVTRDYLSGEEAKAEGIDAQGCMPYRYLRPLCFDMIKGKRTPRSFRFTFLLPRQQIAEMLAKEPGISLRPENVAALSLNMKYGAEELMVTTGCSMHIFLPDKSLEDLWDAWVLQFFRDCGVAIEKMI
jgi:hypothetical protein